MSRFKQTITGQQGIRMDSTRDAESTQDAESTRDPGQRAPRDQYEARLRARREELKSLEQGENQIVRGRMAAFCLTLLVGWATYTWPVVWPSLSLPAILFVVLVSRHRRLRARQSEMRRATKYYQRAINRLDEKWRGVGPDGVDYLDPEHLYAGDLDLFGPGSFFQRMSAAVTVQGERELADWLTHPADADEISGRQGAIRQLRDDLDLREALGRLDVKLHDRLDPDALKKWAEEHPEPVLLSAQRRGVALIISAVALVAMSWWIMTWQALPFVAMLGVASAFLVFMREPLRRQLNEMEEALGNLDQLIKVLRLFEQQEFQHPRLQLITSLLQTDQLVPSQQIARLHRIVEQYEGFQRNQMLIPISMTLLLPFHFARAIELWRENVGSHIPQWLDAVGQMEAFCSLSGYWFERPCDTLPEIAENGPVLIAREIGHPLIRHEDCVRNDVELDESRQLMMVSGSNMSGKSTMLRAVGVNAVLALAGAPVCAKYLRQSTFSIGTSMRIADSLMSGTSHFYAELRRLRSIVDLSELDRPVLFLLDEILHGTNSKDRKIGAEAVLTCLLDRNAIGFVTTHDLALTDIADQLEGTAVNVHFADHFEEGEMVFDYKMQPGVVKKSNALQLMRSLGLDV